MGVVLKDLTQIDAAQLIVDSKRVDGKAKLNEKRLHSVQLRLRDDVTRTGKQLSHLAEVRIRRFTDGKDPHRTGVDK